MCSPKPFNLNAFEPNTAEDANSPSRNLFGDARLRWRNPEERRSVCLLQGKLLSSASESYGLTLDPIGRIGNTVTVARDRVVCFDPICRSGVFEANIFVTERLLWDR